MKFGKIILPVLGFWLVALSVGAQTNVPVRVMAANITSGTQQAYEAPGIRIFQGLKPDVVAIQEFNYAGKTPAEMRTFVDTAFGTNFSYYRESASFQIPNGIISRWPILQGGSWTDSVVVNRSYAWARIDLPGTNDLYVISVHLLNSGSAADRNTEANEIKSNIAANFPAGAWVVVAGDFNVSSRTESAINTFKTFLSDNPIPTDLVSGGNPDTNEPRSTPYDYVLPSFSLTNYQVSVVVGANTFPKGLVFDSTIFANNYTLGAVSPVQSGDSHVSGMQHMAVIKDFSIPVAGGLTTNPPAITTQPQSQGMAVGNPATFSVLADGSAPLSYQWRFNGTNISGATTNPFVLPNVQTTNAGNYSVVITNLFGSVTSSNAVLTVTNAPPSISMPPQSQNVLAGQTVSFSVTAGGTFPLSYQWRLAGANLSGATTNPFILSNVQPANAGDYSVVITNLAGSVTSSVATLTVVVTNPVVFARWDFNSLTPDANVATGTANPSVGTGTASLVGGATATFATGDTAFDPAGSTDNSGWNTANYPAQGTGNKTRGVQFAVSTVGKQNLAIIWSSEAPGTGSKYGRLQCSTNGTDFVDFPAAFTNLAGFTVKTNSLAGISGVNNNPNFAFRFVSEFESTASGTANSNYVAASGSYSAGGTMRFDMVSVSGISYVVATPATLATTAFTNGRLAFSVAGSTGASYVVQVATNLSSTNWLPVFTNLSPFSFSETNLDMPQKFYRAVAQ